MALRERMRKLGGREPEADDERQVEQQFQRSCNTMHLVSIAPTHLPGMMVKGVGVARSNPGSQKASTVWIIGTQPAMPVV